MSEAELDRASEPLEVRGYCMYDWGKSAFETSVVSAIFPTWFAFLFLEANGLNTTIAGITMEGDALIAYLVALGTWAVAIVAPALGVIADYKPVKMSWLRILTYVGAGATFMLGFDFLMPGNEWIWLLIFYFIANIGLNAAGVFYNALLPHLGTDDEMDDSSPLHSPIENKEIKYPDFVSAIFSVFDDDEFHEQYMFLCRMHDIEPDMDKAFEQFSKQALDES